MFHALDATIGTTTSGLWLFNSTGQFTRINDRETGVDNIMFGVRDKDFPKYKKIQLMMQQEKNVLVQIKEVGI